MTGYEELNAWLLDRCVAYAKAHKHPELTDRTIWQAFEAERAQLVQLRGPFDKFHATQASVSKTCLLSIPHSRPPLPNRNNVERVAVAAHPVNLRTPKCSGSSS